MSKLVRHDSVIFDDRTVYLDGNAYIGCTFRRCTIYFRGGEGFAQRCAFEGCVWHLDLVVSDRSVWEQLNRSLFVLMAGSLVQPEPLEPATAPADID